MASFPFQKKLPLSKLNLNQENPRFDSVESQKIALATMIESKKGDELWNLAKDIVENGLNPSEIPIVYQNDDGDYVVKDGNRRVAALLAISKPSSIPTDDEGYINRFKKLKTKAILSKIRQVPCVIFNNEQDADRWVQLNHTGKNKGVGTVEWDSIMKERFRSHIDGRTSMQLQAFNFVERHADSELREKLADFPLTNLERLLGNPDFRSILGFTLDDGTLKYEIPKDEALRNLTKVVHDLATDVKVDQIYSKYLMSKYADKLRSEGYLKSAPKCTPTPVEEAREPPEKIIEVEKKSEKARPSVGKRNRLIPDDCNIVIDEPRVNAIYEELKRLNVKDYPNATSVLFRVFFEMSLNRYIIEKNVERINADSKLISKIQKVHEHFVNNGIMKKEEMQRLMMLTNATGNQPIPMTTQFNGYVHNPDFNPLTGDLKVLWDNLQPFILKLWE